MLKVIQLFVLAVCTQAFYNSNINYESPSRRHDPLAIDIPKVEKRLVTERKLIPRGTTAELNFTHGVASGDPLSDRVILWTRIAPVNNQSQDSPICVHFKVSSSNSMSNAVSSGTAYTSSDVDYTVKVDATGLKPFTTYYYQFQSCDGSISSTIGRTKTAPAPEDEVTSGIRLAVYSCSNYRMIYSQPSLISAQGFFNAYGGPVRRDSVDYVLHIGDYIYEYAECECIFHFYKLI
jgi:alkaline phosphatase D